MVERLFLAVPWGCLLFVIVVFPDHTHLLFLGVCNQMKRDALIACCVCDFLFHGYRCIPDIGRVTLKSNALNNNYLPKWCIELAFPLLDFEKSNVLN